MFERFLRMPTDARHQAINEARNILENFRIILSGSDKGKSISKQGTDSDESNSGDEGIDGILCNALEEEILFQELLLLHPELLAKLLAEHNKKLQAILADLRQRETNNSPTDDNQEHGTSPERQYRNAVKCLEWQMQTLRLQAACEIKEMRARKKQKHPQTQTTAKGLDAILEQMVRPAMAHNERTFAISYILQAPEAALPEINDIKKQPESERNASDDQRLHAEREKNAGPTGVTK